ncbi:MAG: RluA family pseudouridine synthase [Candidatus Hydrogenedentota bacterium]
MNKPHRPSQRHAPKGVIILYEDRDLLIVDKPPGLLTVGTDRITMNTLYSKLTDFVRKGNSKSRERVFIVHRLDRDVSGVIVFARNEQAKFKLQENWDNADKRYLAVVHGNMPLPSGTLSSYLDETKAHVVYSTKDPKKGKLSETAYTVLEASALYSLLEVRLLTGRKHQIRVHLSEAQHPIVGDKKYGKAGDSQKRIALHAKSLAFAHPFSGKPVSFETLTPPFFEHLMAK